ncbi:hypothetical protein ACLBWP_05990 [Microbacterium sp. M1A1_1b]|uniref:hypothetical protein n=1 Tax=Curtobacterium sp. VKM Ac-2922 TaxID=2929475 RepID=UPI001FB512BE|nr:hypothetical protein [Curtobacterium sp. VKM Ac-2922]MCJ1714620.1 hypothetical protein [Curtobacterium sp. VKM Ac-2922]
MSTAIRAPRWQRVVTAVVLGPVLVGTGLAVGAVAFVPGASARAFVAVLGVAFVVGGVWLCIRLPRVAIRLDDDTLRYDGFLVSWTAPRAGITTVLDDCFVEWQDAAGRQRRRQLWMLAPAYRDDGTKTAPLWRWRRQALLQVRDWAHARST